MSKLTDRQLLVLSLGIAEVASQIDDAYGRGRIDSADLEDLLVGLCRSWPNDRENAVAGAREYLRLHQRQLTDLLREEGIVA